MKTHGLIRVIVILVVLLLIICVWNQYYIIEGFESSPLQMYVISLKHADRMENIQKQEKKIGQPIHIFDAVKGDFLDIPSLISSGLVDKQYENSTKKQKREIGCYMSHLRLIEDINERSGYTIIFEDDFDVTSPTFIKEVSDILLTLETHQNNFDLLFLYNQEGNKGELVVNNIYKMNTQQHLFGTCAYIVNNRNINKILEGIQLIDRPIDVKYESLGNSGLLNILIIDPVIVNPQWHALPSNISNLSVETFSLGT